MSAYLIKSMTPQPEPGPGELKAELARVRYLYDAAIEALRTIHDMCSGERQCKTTAAIALCWPHPVSARPKVLGVSRVDDNPKALILALDEVPSDDDMRAVHEALR